MVSVVVVGSCCGGISVIVVVIALWAAIESADDVIVHLSYMYSS